MGFDSIRFCGCCVCFDCCLCSDLLVGLGYVLVWFGLLCDLVI